MKFLNYIKSHVVLSSGVAFIVIAGMIIAGRVAHRGQVVDANQSNIKKVMLVDVNNFRDNLSRVSADGIVESVSQVDLKSQISAPLSAVNVAVGDSVFAGQTIAVLQNADISAQLEQAKAGLRLAQGQYTGSGISLDSARKSALETLRSSYLTADEIVNVQLSQFLYESTGGNPKLSSLIIDAKLGESMRSSYIKSKDSFSDWKDSIDSLSISSSDTDIEKVIISSENNLKDIGILLDYVSEATTKSVQSFSDSISIVNSWQAIVTSARSSANNSIKALTGASATLSSAQVTYQSPAEAQISSAQAIVKNLEASLAKTVFTSPISGKIAALPLRVGELAQPGQLIATVVGEGGLQIKAYASAEDLPRIKSGAKVLVQGTIAGTVVNVAPSVNQINKKIEVKVLVNDSSKSGLVIGQNVSISIEAEAQATVNNYYVLPIQNIKIIPGSAFVFTVDENSKIVKNPIIIGKIQGDFVEVTSGISNDMKIVSPVYELEEGETVIAQ